MQRPFAAYQGDEPYVFVCFAHADATLVYPEIQRLHEGGIRIWYDEGISPGTRWSDETARALSKASVVLFFCTSQSVRSKHCQDELNFALDEDRPLLVIQDGEVDLPGGLRLRLGAHQSILKQDLSTQQFADKLTTAISRHLVRGPSLAPATPKSARSRTRRPLRYVAAAGIAVVLTALLWRMWPLVTSEPKSLVSATASTDMEYTVAVLPFRALSSEAATVTFAQGLTDELINELTGPMPAQVRRLIVPYTQPLRVASAQSTLRYRDTTDDLATISRALGAAYLVEGSVQSAGDQVRLVVRLVHAADDDSVWSHTYDEPIADPLRAQSSIVRDAARRIAVSVPDMYRMGPESGRGLFANADARDYYVRANREYMSSFYGADVDWDATVANFEKSLALDPTYAWTYENLLDIYLYLMPPSLQPVTTVAPIDDLFAQLTELLRPGPAPFGLSLDRLLSLRAEYSLSKLDYVNVNHYLAQSLKARPNDLGGLRLQAVLLLHQERPDAALAAFRRSIDAGGGPLIEAPLDLARLLRGRGQSVAAVKVIDSALAFFPGDLGKTRLLIEQATDYVTLRDGDRAATLVDQAWDLCGLKHPDLFPAALAATGRADRARAILSDLEAAAPTRRFNPLDMIEGYVALGDLDAAFRWIDRAVDARFEPVVRWMHLVTVSVSGVWPTALTADPRWQQAYAKLPKVLGV